jgi:RND family efflux transporter MFP subunit
MGGVALLLAAFSLAGCGQPPAAAEKTAPLVRAQTVALTDYADTISLSGEIRAQVEVGLAFRTSGRITERLVDVGDHVTQGQLVARLDPAEQQADVDAAQATVSAADAQLQQASAALDRQKALLAQGVTTRSQVDQAQTAYDSAAASLKAAQAQLASAQEELGFTTLRASADGIITARNADVGELATAAQAVFTLAEDGGRDAVFGVQESAFLDRPDPNSIDIALISDPKITARGRIREVSPTIDPQTGTVEVKIAIDDPPPQMALGAAVAGTARGQSRQAVVLPWSALWSSGATPAVWLVDPANHTVSLQPVTIAAFDTASVAIASGLSAGQQVVTEGGKLLHPGQVVRVEGSGS